MCSNQFYVVPTYNLRLKEEIVVEINSTVTVVDVSTLIF